MNSITPYLMAISLLGSTTSGVQAQVITARLQPYAHLQIGRLSSPTGREGGPRLNVRVAFGSDEEIVLSWLEQTIEDKQAGESPSDLHLVIQRYLLHDNALQIKSRKVYPASSLEDSAEVLPDGRTLLNADAKLTMLHNDQFVMSRSVGNICDDSRAGSDASDDVVATRLFTDGLDLGLLNLEWRGKKAPAYFDAQKQFHVAVAGKSRSQYCWFDLRTLETIKKVTGGGSFPELTMSGFHVYTGTPGNYNELTPDGEHPVNISPECETPKYVDFREPRFLRWKGATATVCPNGLVVQINNKATIVKTVKEGYALPILVADAKSSPIVVLRAGYLQYHGGVGKQVDTYTAVDYENAKTVILSRSVRSHITGLYIPLPVSVGVSDDGSNVAIYDGDELSVYKLGSLQKGS